ncbi:MAG: lysine exporter LysO family protein [Muribaculaceae bacterium]|nr:lysine exporter LysO family protein [Muribaculaceae bacterium]
MKGSLIIVGFFVLGIVCGVMHWLPDLNAWGNVSVMTLYALLFCVGMTVGNNTALLKSFTKLDPRLMLLPLMTIVGTLSATAIAAIGLPHRSLTDCLAVGSGFGYYSLSSILITQYRGPDLGTVALLANIIREVFTLLGAPLLVRYFGPLAPISTGGATTMDTTLPIITRTSGQDFVLLSLFHGFLVDFSVPFLVTFFCSI